MQRTAAALDGEPETLNPKPCSLYGVYPGWQINRAPFQTLDVGLKAEIIKASMSQNSEITQNLKP